MLPHNHLLTPRNFPEKQVGGVGGGGGHYSSHLPLCQCTQATILYQVALQAASVETTIVI